MNKKELLDNLKMEWSDCRRCPLGELAYRHVLFDTEPKGVLTVKVLFIGEGPGESEDSLGRPFIGPAGDLLRKVIRETNTYKYTVGYTNLVACRPTDGRTEKNRTPYDFEVKACRPRLVKVIELLEPEVLVCLGRVPEFYIPLILWRYGISIPVWNMYHPAYLTRSGGEESSKYEHYKEEMRTIFRTLKSVEPIDEVFRITGPELEEEEEVSFPLPVFRPLLEKK